MKKIMIMMVMMLTIVVSTSGKNNTNVKNDRNNVVVVNKTIVRHDDNKCCKYGTPTGARHGAVRRWYASASVTERTLAAKVTIALARNALR